MQRRGKKRNAVSRRRARLRSGCCRAANRGFPNRRGMEKISYAQRIFFLHSGEGRAVPGGKFSEWLERGNGFGLPEGRLFAITGRKIFGMIRKGERFRFTERETFCNYQTEKFPNGWKGGTVSVYRKGDFLQSQGGKFSEWLEREKIQETAGKEKCSESKRKWLYCIVPRAE